MEQGNQKKFLLSKTISFEPGSNNSHILEQDTCDWQSICYQATLRFKISLREKFSKVASFRVMKQMLKDLSCTF